MKISALLSGTILAALGIYAYLKSSDLMNLINEFPQINAALYTIMGTSGTFMVLLTQIVGIGSFLAGFIIIAYGLVWPIRNKPVKDVQVKMEFTINHKTPRYNQNDYYNHIIRNERNDPYANKFRKAEMRDQEIR
ncbi:hypothetical protein ACFL96_14130 [Thermoproteota archaeon]